MKNITAFAAWLALASTLSTAPAQAQAARTFVSPTGSDTAACSLTAPCRSFAAAYALTNAGGEIAVLGTAGYGSLTINKAISIVNGGGFEAEITVPSGNIGINIAAGVNDAVSLRGLTIDGNGNGVQGIRFSAGKSLTIENCIIRHTSNANIFFLPNSSSSLAISDTVIADGGTFGILFQPTGSGAVTGVFNRVTMTNNPSGGLVVDGSSSTGSLDTSVSDSVISNSAATAGVAVLSSGNAPAKISLFHSVVAENITAMSAIGSGAILYMAQSMITGNTHAWDIESSGILYSYGDNYVDNNGSHTGSLTTLTKQ
jgi:hypothetical protein